MSDVSSTPSIEESDTPDVVEEFPAEHPGVVDGEVVTSTIPADESGSEVGTVEERIVYDYDEGGDQIGWHKEAVNG